MTPENPQAQLRRIIGKFFVCDKCHNQNNTVLVFRGSTLDAAKSSHICNESIHPSTLSLNYSVSFDKMCARIIRECGLSNEGLKF